MDSPRKSALDAARCRSRASGLAPEFLINKSSVPGSSSADCPIVCRWKYAGKRMLSTNHDTSCCAVVSCARDVSVRNRVPLVSAAPRLRLPRKSSRSSCGLQGNLVSLGLQFAHPPNFHPPLCAAAHAHSSRRLSVKRFQTHGQAPERLPARQTQVH